MRREWTKQEELYMEKKYTKQPIEKTAKILNRSIFSVKRKANRLQLNHYADYFNAKTIARCFNSDVSVVIRWIQKFTLPCKKVICPNQTRYLIDPNDFWKWAEENKNIINWSKYEKLSICPEPSWLDDVVKSSINTRHRSKYTQDEILRVKSMLYKGMSYSEIAEQMGRTYYGISHLCRRIYS